MPGRRFWSAIACLAVAAFTATLAQPDPADAGAQHPQAPAPLLTAAGTQ